MRDRMDRLKGSLGGRMDRMKEGLSSGMGKVWTRHVMTASLVCACVGGLVGSVTQVWRLSCTLMCLCLIFHTHTHAHTHTVVWTGVS